MADSDSSTITPIHRKDLTSEIIDSVFKMISDGNWEPGEKLPSQRKLASQMDVSMASLREALYSLQAMGVLEMRHGAGTYITDNLINPNEKIVELSLLLGRLDIRKFFEAREVIETGLASLAAEHATNDQIDNLYQILNEQKTAFEFENEEHLHNLDLAFHQQLAEMANNKILSQMNENLMKNLDKLFRALPLSRKGWILHMNVAKAIKDRLSSNAYLAMKELIQFSYTKYLPYIENYEESQKTQKRDQ
jgi:GntR family transcriptional repressor for pyruvate dehydrogenase complex